MLGKTLSFINSKKEKTVEPFHFTNRKHKFCNYDFPWHSWWEKNSCGSFGHAEKFKINTMTKICVPRKLMIWGMVAWLILPNCTFILFFFQEQIHELASTFPPIPLIKALTVKRPVNMFQMFPLIPANRNTNTHEKAAIYKNCWVYTLATYVVNICW